MPTAAVQMHDIRVFIDLELFSRFLSCKCPLDVRLNIEEVTIDMQFKPGFSPESKEHQISNPMGEVVSKDNILNDMLTK